MLDCSTARLRHLLKLYIVPPPHLTNVMSTSAFTFNNVSAASPYTQYDTFSCTPAVDVSMIETPGSVTPSQTPARRTRRRAALSQQQPRQVQNVLEFVPLDEWDEHNSYHENEPSCLHYSIEWKVYVNKRMVSKDTEQDLVLAPTAYWHMFLKPKLEKLLRKKLSQNRSIRCDETNVVVSVTGRSERDLTKRFDDTDIDWTIVERQLLGWGELFRSGKKLRITISFHYTDSSGSAAAPGRGKRGSSATKQMLADRAAQLDAEQDTSGHPSIWREVYALMQCPGSPCDLGPHCWRDPTGKKHYKLRTHHLKALIDYVEQGHRLVSQEDVPEYVREQLMAEEQQRLERQPRATACSTPYPPINITNVLPHASPSPATDSVELIRTLSTKPAEVASLEIPGPRDVAVTMYGEWQQSNVVGEKLKSEFRKVCDVALEEGLDLEQIYEDQDPGFFIQSGVKRGIARRFVSDIEGWVKQYKLSVDTVLI
jgi:hypothetical protein